MSHAYFPKEFCWCLNINRTYIKNMLLAHRDGSFVWNIHMYSTYTYVGCTFTPHPNSKHFIYFNVRCTKSILCTCCTFSMLEGCYIVYVLESQWVLICLQHMILILIVFPLIYWSFFLHIIYPFIYVILWHLVLNEISWSCWNLVNDALISFCLWHLLLPIRSHPVIIMLVAIHMIWLFYARVMTLQFINYCIMYLLTAFPLHICFSTFHPSPCLCISFEIVNRTKLFHHYLTRSSFGIVFGS
jgi:hypothetical protein